MNDNDNSASKPPVTHTSETCDESDCDHHDPVAGQESTQPSRRRFLKTSMTGLAAGAVVGSGLAGQVLAGPGQGKGPPQSPPGQGKGNGGGSGDLRLVNGKFVDGRGEVATAMTIKNGRIVSLGKSAGLGPDAQTINLHGRTVIPGFVNSHVHHSRTGINPGHEERDIETAFSIAEIQELLARRAATVPSGEFIGCHLGWHYVQLDENRPPTKAELDDAAPGHPVFLSGRAGFVEEHFAVTNSLGQMFFEDAGLTVDNATGRINATPESARQAIQDTETPEDNLRQTFDNNAWTLSNGVTNLLDASGSPVTAQDFPALELWRQGRLHLRHRLNVSSSSPEVVEARTQNVFRMLGDDLLRMGGFGETIGSRSDLGVFEATARAVAEAGWKGQHHTDFFDQVDDYTGVFQTMAADGLSLDGLRWQLIHAFQVTATQAQALKDLGVGVDLENERYLDRAERGGGPFFRLLVDSGINIGIGTDGSNWAPNNPWLMMYYMTTGVSVRGVPNNADQTISRLEALRLFTSGSAYQIFDDDKLGAFEVGKYADLAVLSDNFLSVSDANLRKIKSLLTIVGGKIVHSGAAPQYAEIGEEFSFTGT